MSYLDDLIRRAKFVASNTDLNDLKNGGKRVMDAIEKHGDNLSKTISKEASEKRRLFETRRQKINAKIATEKATVSGYNPAKDFGDNIKNIKPDFSKGVYSGIKDTASQTYDNATLGAYQAYQSTKKVAGIKMNPFQKVDPDWNNMFTGYRLKSGVAAAGAAGAIAFGVGMGYVETEFGGPRGGTRKEVAGTLPGLSYDGVANAVNGRRDLGATGDLVFGLHNQRRGR